MTRSMTDKDRGEDDGFGEQVSLDFISSALTGRALGTAEELIEDVQSDPGGVAPEAPIPKKPKARLRTANHQKGHRSRLRERFLNAGHLSVADYEMLELVLFRAIPQRDVKPLAKRLIEQFGDFNGVISAPATRLKDIPGVGPSVVCELKVIEAAAHRLARAKVMNKHAVSSWSELMDYCKTTMAHREIEQFRILFLDRKNVLIADEEQAKGTVDHVPVYPREVVKRALELNASSLILVHNHPSGDPTPSRADVDMTRLIEKAAKAVGITLHDHVIVGKELDTSFRGTGLL